MKFGDLKFGECFIYETNVYMRTHEFFAYQIETGNKKFFIRDATVRPTPRPIYQEGVRGHKSTVLRVLSASRYPMTAIEVKEQTPLAYFVVDRSLRDLTLGGHIVRIDRDGLPPLFQKVG